MLQEQMDSVNAHSVEVSSKLDVADDSDYVFQQTLKTASFSHCVANLLIKLGEEALVLGHIVLDPRCKVERVVEAFAVGVAASYLLQKPIESLCTTQVSPVVLGDFAHCMHMLCMSEEFLTSNLRDHNESHLMAIVWQLALPPHHF